MASMAIFFEVLEFLCPSYLFIRYYWVSSLVPFSATTDVLI